MPVVADNRLHRALVCPDCRTSLSVEADQAHVACAEGHRFPLTDDGVPVLLSSHSAFDAGTIVAGRDTYHAHHVNESKRLRRFRQWLPGLATDIQSHDADAMVNRLLADSTDGTDVDGTDHGLVIGAGFRVQEYRERFPSVSWLISDTEATFGADVVGDVALLPVADASQSFVLCEHVLEHVVDPIAAAREIERVLCLGGVALVKVPFNYPWHGGFIDFYRFTPAGYLAAFRRMDALHIGHGPGPASTITYALAGALAMAFSGRTARRVAVVVGRVVIGPWRKLDRFLVTRQGSLGSSCTMIFIGRRVEHSRTAAEVVAQAKALGVAPVLGPAQRP